MTASNFERSFRLTLRHEGGYVDHPADPGGATNKGVTQATYNAWRRSQGLATRSVRQITDAELLAIYKDRYWDAIEGDQLPLGLDYCVYDFGVNSGPSRAIRYLQTAVGVTPDGHIGPLTIEAIRSADVAKTIERICDNRMSFLRGLRHWSTFGRGWTSRVSSVRKGAIAMVRGRPPEPSKPPLVWSKETEVYQEQLAALGYYDGDIDGLHGPVTDAAVRKFQADHGLGIDGIVGENTGAALESAMRKSKQPTVPPEEPEEPPERPPDGGDPVSPTKPPPGGFFTAGRIIGGLIGLVLIVLAFIGLTSGD